MKILSAIGSSVFQVISLGFFFCYLFGTINVYFTDKNDYCVMTYMFEYPQFVRISIPENAIYPQYGLYAYSEGRLTERARKMWFNGVPVLFLPGNGGSYKQARSLASVALRKAMDKLKHEFHFDYFTISYNEELSGLYGGVLQSETKFAAACIQKILSLYKSNKYTKNVPTSVILIGHSMGGLIAKRLLAYPSTITSTYIAIALAAPLQAPVVNTDIAMNDYYKLIDFEWNTYVNNNKLVKEKKMVLSFGNGPRDVLMPSGLTSTNESYVGTLTTALPGAWVSPDHVSIVWCKQVVMAINKYLFSIVNPVTEQLYEDNQKWRSNAKFYFQANRSMILSPNLPRANMTMLADAFWFEDNRRIYQISRPDVSRMTYLMIRLITFPQNRFVAIEAINLEDSEWIFGCNAMYTYSTYRYCKQATSLSEMSRWTGTAEGFGKRKLATINLHRLKDDHPDWTHVIVKVSPTRKPLILNVDVNDHASRVITVDLPSDFTFGKNLVLQETEANSLYYELLLPGFNKVQQAYLLHVEPTASCKATHYHVSAELYVPWAKNQEFFHYFTPLKQSPMKLRLYTSSPNVTNGLETTEHAKVTLLLDPQCTYTISISSSWYTRLAQLARNYSPVLVPYIGAIVLLAARSSFLHLNKHGTFLSMHGALMSEGVKPYYALVFARFGSMVLMSIPVLSFLLENASWKNLELQYFTRSLLVLPAYMTALGIVNVAAAALIAAMVFSSQLAHRLLFRLVCRGRPASAERVAAGLEKMPMLVSAVIVGAVPMSCGAASLAAGAAFYAFMISKMYEEYLEDYVYKLMAKIASRICYIFKKRNATPTESETSLVPTDTAAAEDSSADNAANASSSTTAVASTSSTSVVSRRNSKGKGKKSKNKKNTGGNKPADVVKVEKKKKSKDNLNKEPSFDDPSDDLSDVDEGLNKLNFHMMMFCLWMCVTLVNAPALLTWARNFKHSSVLKPDTSYHTGLVMSVCSGCIWQMEGPRHKLRNYENVGALMFVMAVFILALGPLSLTIVNYGIAFIFAVLTVQQLCDKYDEEAILGEFARPPDDITPGNIPCYENNANNDEIVTSEEEEADPVNNEQDSKEDNAKEEKQDECNVCDENRIYTVFKNIRDKFNYFGEET